MAIPNDKVSYLSKKLENSPLPGGTIRTGDRPKLFDLFRLTRNLWISP